MKTQSIDFARSNENSIDFAVIFLMQLSEFVKSVSFGSYLKKDCIKQPKIVHFLPENLLS